MRRLDDAMKLGSPPHIRFIKIDDAGATIASRSHGHKTVTASTSPDCADARIKRLDAAIAWLVSSTVPPGSILEDRASSERGRLGSGEKLLAGLVNHVTRVARSRE